MRDVNQIIEANRKAEAKEMATMGRKQGEYTSYYTQEQLDARIREAFFEGYEAGKRAAILGERG